MASSEDKVIWPFKTPAYDAHCHPTDHEVESAHYIRSDMRTAKLTCMSTNLKDIFKVADLAKSFPDRILPCFGYHPWFTHWLTFGDDTGDHALSSPEAKLLHYRSVLFPLPESDFIDTLPDLISFSDVEKVINDMINEFPDAWVGEIGLDKSFRIPHPREYIKKHHTEYKQISALSPYRVSLNHQKRVLTSLLRIAGKNKRPVSVHGVQCHGVLLNTFNEMWKGHELPSRRRQKEEIRFTTSIEKADKPSVDFPTNICLHSYSGPVEQVRQWLDPRIPSWVYFSFSMLVNQRYGDKFRQVLESIPDDRLLLETDFHKADQQLDNHMIDIINFVSKVKGWDPEKCLQITGENFRKFCRPG